MMRGRGRKAGTDEMADEIVFRMYSAMFAGLDDMARGRARERLLMAVLMRMAASMNRDLWGDSPAGMYA